ncbi:MAG: hypothetical protein HQ534_14590 [Armatimonadetes bacterium]|nr:hypothetical protein [Armatimonadota bacterium]
MFKTNKEISFLIFILAICIFACTSDKKSLPEKEDSLQVHQEIHSENLKPEFLEIRDSIQIPEIVIPEKIPYPDFTRGIYLSGFTVGYNNYEAILDSAEATGINTVVFDLKDMKGNIFFALPENDPIRKKRISPIIDIPDFVKTLHKRNMRAVARIVMFHDRFLAKRDSLVRPRKSDGTIWQENRKGKPSWLDSSHSEAQKELLRIIEVVAKKGVDEIQLDYIRFPTQGKISEAIFQFQKKDSLFAIADSNYVFRTKSDIIEEFVKQAKEICLKHNVTLTGDIFAIVAWQRKVDISNTGQKISKMTKYLDAIHPMIYSSHFSKDFGFREKIYDEPYFIVFKGTKLTQRYSNKKCKVIPYIQANRWRVKFKPEFIYAQIQAVNDLNADGYILWNAANKYFDSFRWIRENQNL